jgi:4'-phosphopantetheinyl transferase
MSVTPPPPAGITATHVDLWLCRPSLLQDDEVRCAALSLLAPEERVRSDRFAVTHDRDSFIAGRAQVRIALARHARALPSALAFIVNPHGKPELSGPVRGGWLNFNVSHTRELAVCAITWNRAIGVDVEAIGDPPLAIADRYFTAPEIAALRALTPDRQRLAFYEIWTLKEAFVKALGVGLSMPLGNFAVRQEPPGLLQWGAVQTPDDWQFARLAPSPGRTLALCVAASSSLPLVVASRWLTPERLARASAQLFEEPDSAT